MKSLLIKINAVVSSIEGIKLIVKDDDDSNKNCVRLF